MHLLHANGKSGCSGCCEIEPADDEQNGSTTTAVAACRTGGNAVESGAAMHSRSLATSSITLGCMDRIWELTDKQQQQEEVEEGCAGGAELSGALPGGAARDVGSTYPSSSSSSISPVEPKEGPASSASTSRPQSSDQSTSSSSSSGYGCKVRMQGLSRASITLAQLYHLKYDCPSCAISTSGPCDACSCRDPGAAGGAGDGKAAAGKGDDSMQWLLTPRGVDDGALQTPRAFAAAGIRSRSWQQLLVQPLSSFRKRAASPPGQIGGGYHYPQVVPCSRSSSSSGKGGWGREGGGGADSRTQSQAYVAAAGGTGGNGVDGKPPLHMGKASNKGGLGAAASEGGLGAKSPQGSDGVSMGGWTTTSRGSSFVGGGGGTHRRSFEQPMSSGVSAAFGASRSHISNMLSEASGKDRHGSLLLAVARAGSGAGGEGRRLSRQSSVVLTAQSLGGALPGCISERLTHCLDVVAQPYDAAAAHGVAVAADGCGAVVAVTAAASRRSSLEGGREVCGVCMDKLAWLAVAGCGHLLCGSCAGCLVEGGVGCRPARCPFCRCAISAFVLVDDEQNSDL